MDKYNTDNKYYKGMTERVGEDFKGWLQRKYWDEELNSRDLAELAYGKRKNGPNITSWMKKLDISARSRTEAVALQWKNNPERRRQAAEIAVEYMGNGTPGRNKLIKIMQTKEYKEKQSINKTGEGNGMYGVVGEASPRWNPDITDEQRQDTRSYLDYIEWRTKVFERDKFTCQRCDCSKGGNLNAHHINGYHWDKDSRVEVDNGITLCKDCHKEFHSIYGYGNNDLFQFGQFMDMTLIK